MLPFFLWTAVNMLLSIMIKWSLQKIVPALLRNNEYFFSGWDIWDWIEGIFGYHFKDSFALDTPFSYQLWFVRDVLLLTILSPVLISLIKRFPLGTLLLTFFVGVQNLPLYIVESQSLFFYVLGLYWGVYDVPLFKIVDRIGWAEAVVLFGISFAGEFLLLLPPPVSWCRILFACILLLKLSQVLVANERLFSVLAYLAGFSFFLFAIHTPVLLRYAQNWWIRVFPMKNAFFCLFEYVGVTILVVAVGTGAGIALKKICPPLFSLLNGGR